MDLPDDAVHPPDRDDGRVRTEADRRTAASPRRGAAAAAPPAGVVGVRPLATGEARALAAAMGRSFGGLGAVMFSPGKATFVAEAGGRLVGGVVLGTFPIDGARRGGIVKWLFTLPEARGSGVASALLDRALVWFDEQGVSDAFAGIEALNAASSNRFAQRGFAPLGFVEQWRRYGVRLPRIWWRCNHVVDVGHLLWARGVDGVSGVGGASVGAGPGQALTGPEHASGLGGFAATLALHAAFGALMLVRLGAEVDLAAVGQVALAVAAVIGVRTAAMALVGTWAGLRMWYRPWETGLVLVGFIALAFGGPFVAPGSPVPASRTWSPRTVAPVLARMAFAGAAAVLVLGVLAAWGMAAGVAAGLAAPVLSYARILATFDVLLPFFPFTAFSGRRMLEASRAGWAALALAAIGLWATVLT